MKFSPSTGCFYPEDIDYSHIPDDAVEVSDGDFQMAMRRAPGETLAIVAGSLVVQPVPDAVVAEIEAYRLKQAAQIELSRSDVTILRCVENGVPVPQAWRDYRAALRRGETPARPAYPEGT